MIKALVWSGVTVFMAAIGFLVVTETDLPAWVGPSDPPAVATAPAQPVATEVPGLPGVVSVCDHGHRVYQVIEPGVGYGRLAVSEDDWSCPK